MRLLKHLFTTCKSERNASIFLIFSIHKAHPNFLMVSNKMFSSTKNQLLTLNNIDVFDSQRRQRKKETVHVLEKCWIYETLLCPVIMFTTS
jgi:hypothetical protein